VFGLPVGCSGNTTSKWCFVLLFLSLFDPCFISNPLSVILVNSRISIFLVFAFSISKDLLLAHRLFYLVPVPVYRWSGMFYVLLVCSISTTTGTGKHSFLAPLNEITQRCIGWTSIIVV